MIKKKSVFLVLLVTLACCGCQATGNIKPGDDLSGKNLAGKDLSGMDLHGVNFHEANLSEANLNGANLSGAKLDGADLSGANLKDANLTEADLSNAVLTGANVSHANLRGAVLDGATLLDITGMTPEQARVIGSWKDVTANGTTARYQLIDTNPWICSKGAGKAAAYQRGAGLHPILVVNAHGKGSAYWPDWAEQLPAEWVEPAQLESYQLAACVEFDERVEKRLTCALPNPFAGTVQQHVIIVSLREAKTGEEIAELTFMGEKQCRELQPAVDVNQIIASLEVYVDER